MHSNFYHNALNAVKIPNILDLLLIFARHYYFINNA